MGNTKKIFSLIVLSIFLFVNSGIASTYAGTIIGNTIKVTSNKSDDIKTEVTRAEAFAFIEETLLYDIPSSYKYISLNYNDIKSGDEYFETLQKLVYADILENKSVNVNLDTKINAYVFYYLLEKAVNIQFIKEGNIDSLKSRNLTKGDLYLVDAAFDQAKKNYDESLEQDSSDSIANYVSSQDDYNKFLVLFDVYNSILSDFYYRDDVDTEDLLNSAIYGLALGANDPYTVYFPPVEAESFDQSLSGEFQGIGAYVEMENGGILKIVSPISDSPAMEAGLKSGDIIRKIDGVLVTEDMTITDAVSKIKGEAGTTVTLEIQRGNNIFEVEVTRAKVTIKDVEYEIKDGTFYIHIKNFGEHVYTELKDALVVLNETQNINKVVFDLRNNPGGYLNQVSNILSLFVEKGEPVAVIKYKGSKKYNYSLGYNLVDLNKYDVYLLENSGTASASEIMIGTLKDYFPDITIVGEQSYGKGSVQTIKYYTDGSSFKFTIAKWFTGKTETGIDHVGITPDVEIKLDEDDENDNQLQYILNK